MGITKNTKNGISKREKLLLIAALSAVLAVYLLYVILHEAGHSLIAILCGAKITRFSIADAAMSYEGGVFTPVTSSLLNAAGMLLPVLVSLVAMLFYSVKITNVFYRVFYFIFSLTSVFASLAWVFIPFFYMFGSAPAGDDVTKFLDNSGMNPWLVSFLALLILSAGILLSLKKRIIQSYWESCNKKQDI